MTRGPRKHHLAWAGVYSGPGKFLRVTTADVSFPKPDQAKPSLELRTTCWATSCHQLWVAEQPKLQSSNSCSQDRQDEPTKMRSIKNFRSPASSASAWSSSLRYCTGLPLMRCWPYSDLLCCWRRKMLTRSFAMGQLVLPKICQHYELWLTLT